MEPTLTLAQGAALDYDCGQIEGATQRVLRWRFTAVDASSGERSAPRTLALLIPDPNAPALFGGRVTLRLEADSLRAPAGALLALDGVYELQVRESDGAASTTRALALSPAVRDLYASEPDPNGPNGPKLPAVGASPWRTCRYQDELADVALALAEARKPPSQARAGTAVRFDLLVVPRVELRTLLSGERLDLSVRHSLAVGRERYACTLLSTPSDSNTRALLAALGEWRADITRRFGAANQDSERTAALLLADDPLVGRALYNMPGAFTLTAVRNTVREAAREKSERQVDDVLTLLNAAWGERREVRTLSVAYGANAARFSVCVRNDGSALSPSDDTPEQQKALDASDAPYDDSTLVAGADALEAASAAARVRARAAYLAASSPTSADKRALALGRNTHQGVYVVEQMSRRGEWRVRAVVAVLVHPRVPVQLNVTSHLGRRQPLLTPEQQLAAESDGSPATSAYEWRRVTGGVLTSVGAQLVPARAGMELADEALRRRNFYEGLGLEENPLVGDDATLGPVRAPSSTGFYALLEVVKRDAPDEVTLFRARSRDYYVTARGEPILLAYGVRRVRVVALVALYVSPRLATLVLNLDSPPASGVALPLAAQLANQEGVASVYFVPYEGEARKIDAATFDAGRTLALAGAESAGLYAIKIKRQARVGGVLVPVIEHLDVLVDGEFWCERTRRYVLVSERSAGAQRWHTPPPRAATEPRLSRDQLIEAARAESDRIERETRKEPSAYEVLAALQSSDESGNEVREWAALTEKRLDALADELRASGFVDATSRSARFVERPALDRSERSALERRDVVRETLGGRPFVERDREPALFDAEAYVRALPLSALLRGAVAPLAARALDPVARRFYFNPKRDDHKARVFSGTEPFDPTRTWGLVAQPFHGSPARAFQQISYTAEVARSDAGLTAPWTQLGDAASRSSTSEPSRLEVMWACCRRERAAEGCWRGQSRSRAELAQLRALDGDAAHTGELSQLLSTPKQRATLFQYGARRNAYDLTLDELDTLQQEADSAVSGGCLDALGVLRAEAKLNALLGGVLRVPYEPTSDAIAATARAYLFGGLSAPSGSAPKPAPPGSDEERRVVAWLVRDMRDVKKASRVPVAEQFRAWRFADEVAPVVTDATLRRFAALYTAAVCRGDKGERIALGAPAEALRANVEQLSETALEAERARRAAEEAAEREQEAEREMERAAEERRRTQETAREATVAREEADRASNRARRMLATATSTLTAARGLLSSVFGRTDPEAALREEEARLAEEEARLAQAEADRARAAAREAEVTARREREEATARQREVVAARRRAEEEARAAAQEAERRAAELELERRRVAEEAGALRERLREQVRRLREKAQERIQSAQDSTGETLDRISLLFTQQEVELLPALARRTIASASDARRISAEERVAFEQRVASANAAFVSERDRAARDGAAIMAEVLRLSTLSEPVPSATNDVVTRRIEEITSGAAAVAQRQVDLKTLVDTAFAAYRAALDAVNVEVRQRSEPSGASAQEALSTSAIASAALQPVAAAPTLDELRRARDGSRDLAALAEAANAYTTALTDLRGTLFQAFKDAYSAARRTLGLANADATRAHNRARPDLPEFKPSPPNFSAQTFNRQRRVEIATPWAEIVGRLADQAARTQSRYREAKRAARTAAPGQAVAQMRRLEDAVLDEAETQQSGRPPTETGAATETAVAVTQTVQRAEASAAQQQAVAPAAARLEERSAETADAQRRLQPLRNRVAALRRLVRPLYAAEQRELAAKDAEIARLEAVLGVANEAQQAAQQQHDVAVAQSGIVNVVEERSEAPIDPNASVAEVVASAQQAAEQESALSAIEAPPVVSDAITARRAFTTAVQAALRDLVQQMPGGRALATADIAAAKFNAFNGELARLGTPVTPAVAFDVVVKNAIGMESTVYDGLAATATYNDARRGGYLLYLRQVTNGNRQFKIQLVRPDLIYNDRAYRDADPRVDTISATSVVRYTAAMAALSAWAAASTESAAR